MDSISVSSIAGLELRTAHSYICHWYHHHCIIISLSRWLLLDLEKSTVIIMIMWFTLAMLIKYISLLFIYIFLTTSTYLNDSIIFDIHSFLLKQLMCFKFIMYISRFILCFNLAPLIHFAFCICVNSFYLFYSQYLIFNICNIVFVYT